MTNFDFVEIKLEDMEFKESVELLLKKLMEIILLLLVCHFINYVQNYVECLIINVNKI